jgi:hypothetical protein
MAEQQNRSPYAHVRVVFSLLFVLVAAALVARHLAFPAGFGSFGHYRDGAVQDAMQSVTPLHATTQICADCHEDEAAQHAKDVHSRVNCEACHGPGGRHVDEQNEVAISRPEGPKIRVPKKSEDCLMCHLRLAARPASYPQIDVASHYKAVFATDLSTPCKACHNPHEPLFLDKNINEARLHPVMNECVDCHKKDINPREALPDGHPILFECNYCHPAIVKDYAERDHSALRCGVCHQYYPVSERAGRIVSHRNPRFCLQCHGDKIARDTNTVKVVAWPQHKIDVEKKDGSKKGEVCVDCHRESYHVASPRREAIAQREEKDHE